jgi:hypothetical protein
MSSDKVQKQYENNRMKKVSSANTLHLGALQEVAEKDKTLTAFTEVENPD